MMEMELKNRADKPPGFKGNLFLNETNLLDSYGKIHVRNLPYYFETYWQQRPVALNPSTDQPVSGHPDGTKPSRFGKSSGLHMKALSARSAEMSRAESYYSQRDSSVSETTKQNKYTMPATNRSEYTASQKLSSYETFLNYLVTKMGHRPELQENAKKFIVLKSEPDLPDFVYPKDLHPKIFWRDVRQPLDRLSRKLIRSECGQRKLLHSHNSKRTFLSMPNSPAPTLATDKSMDFETNQTLKEHAGTGTGDNHKDRKPKSRHSAGRRKKKSKNKSKRKRKNSSKGKNRQDGLHDCRLHDSDSESSSGDNGSTTDEGSNSYRTSNKNRKSKKEKKIVPGQRPTQKEEMDEGHQMENEEEEEENGKSEVDENKLEENSSFEFGTDIPALPKYTPESRMQRRLSVRKRSAFSVLKKTIIESEKTTEPETRMFSSSKPMKTVKYNNKDTIQSWLQEQLDFSLKPCRFELPVDSRELEATSPEEYLRTYCIVTSQFHSLYKNVFKKYQSPAMLRIEYKNLEIALRDVAVNSFTSEKLQILGTFINLNETSAIDYKLFAGMAALAERLSDSKIESLKKTESSQDGSMKKERIEIADFSALEWKFKDVDINRNMKQLLSIIAL